MLQALNLNLLNLFAKVILSVMQISLTVLLRQDLVNMDVFFLHDREAFDSSQIWQILRTYRKGTHIRLVILSISNTRKYSQTKLLETSISCMSAVRHKHIPISNVTTYGHYRSWVIVAAERNLLQHWHSRQDQCQQSSEPELFRGVSCLYTQKAGFQYAGSRKNQSLSLSVECLNLPHG